MKLRITDNAYRNNAKGWRLEDCFENARQALDEERSEVARDLNIIGGKALGDILKENPNLLVFPQCIGSHNDGIDQLQICSYSEAYDRLYTGNLMGFVGVNDTQLSITSRFAQADADFFLHYMLIKVFCPNILRMNHDTSPDSAFDFMMYMFPHYLNEAIKQGIYKEYRYFSHNDISVKGAIDISRQICSNIPFKGNVAYNTREHSFDNHITQLIRHTIEYIKSSYIGKFILDSKETRSNVQSIISITPNYKYSDRRKIIADNIREVRHPYFTKYTALQKICLGILRHKELKYGTSNDKIYGILFDGAWLWEEFLNTILKPLGLIHSENKIGRNPIYLFENNKYVRYPDFYLSNHYVIDAKYKHLGMQEIARDDIHQIISYLHVLNADKAFLAYPMDKGNVSEIIIEGRLNGMKGDIGLMGLRIPQMCNSMKTFDEQMNNEIKVLHKEWKTMIYATQ